MSLRGSAGRTDVRRNRRRHRYMMLLRKRLVVEPLMSAAQTIHRLQMAFDGRRRMLPKKRLVVNSTAAQPISTLQIKIENLLCMVAGVCLNDSNMQQEATTLIRKLLCLGSVSIEEVVNYGVLPIFFADFFKREGCLQLQFEAVEALAKIATPEYKSSIGFLDDVAVPYFLKLLANLQSQYGLDQAVCWLGNIVRLHRDHILSLLKKDAKLSILRNDTLTLMDFCKGKPYPPTFELTKEAIFGVLESLLVVSNDVEVLTNTCSALLYLSTDGNKIQALIEAGFCQRLVELLQHPSPCVVIPALITVASIVTRIDVQIHQVIETRLIAPLVNLLKLDIKKEFGRAISKANKEEIKYLLKRGCFKPLYDLLLSRDPRIMSASLQGFEKVAEALEDKNFGNLVSSFTRLFYLS